MTESGHVSIWFFVGILLTVYGLLILGAGVYSLVVPPANPPVLNYLHADLWWSGFLFLVGIAYLGWFFPRKPVS